MYYLIGQPVRECFGPRFYDWQLEQTPEEIFLSPLATEINRPSKKLFARESLDTQDVKGLLSKSVL